MLLLTGATGLVGSALLPRLTATGRPVRCLVRDPRRLGAERVRVQLALGDLSRPVPHYRLGEFRRLSWALERIRRQLLHTRHTGPAQPGR